MKTAQEIMYDFCLDLRRGAIKFSEPSSELDRNGGIKTAGYRNIVNDKRLSKIGFNSWLDNQNHWQAKRWRVC